MTLKFISIEDFWVWYCLFKYFIRKSQKLHFL